MPNRFALGTKVPNRFTLGTKVPNRFALGTRGFDFQTLRQSNPKTLRMQPCTCHFATSKVAKTELLLMNSGTISFIFFTIA